MKNYVLFVLLGLGLFLSSCNKEEMITNTSDASPDELFEYSKDVTLEDATGENTAVMRIYSDSEEDLASYSSRNFVLVPVMKGQTSEEAQIAAGILQPNTETEEAAELQAEEARTGKANRAFELISKSLAPGVKSYAIHFNLPTSFSRSWNYNWHYSQTNVDETGSITRSSMWHRVYFGLSYKATSGSSWSTIISEWYKLDNNQTLTRTRSNCNRMRFHVQYKKNGNYTVEFTD